MRVLLFLGLCLCPALGQMYPIERFSTENGLPHFTSYTTWADGDGRLWIGTRGGLVRYDGVGMTPIATADDAGARTVHHLVGDDTWVYAATHEGTFRLPLPSGAPAERIWDRNTHRLLRDADGNLWLADTQGVSRRAPDGTVQRLDLPGGDWRALAEDARGTVWVGGQAGLFAVRDGTPRRVLPGTVRDVTDLLAPAPDDLWAVAGKRLFRIRAGLVEQPDPVAEDVRCLALDAHANLWVGTGHGAWFAALNPATKAMQFRPLGPDQGLHHPLVHQIAPDGEGNLWFASEIGLYRLRRLAFRRYDMRGGLLDNTVWGFCADADGRLWIATRRGVDILHPDGRHSYLTQEQGLPPGEIRAVTHDGGGGHFLGGRGGLVHVKADKPQRIDGADGPCAPFVRTLAHDGAGRLWVGTDRGGACYGRPGAFRHLRTADGLPADRIFTLAPHGEAMWLGTEAGAALWDGDAVSRTLTTADGLPADMVFAVAPQDDGSLWVGTVAGLAHVRGEAVRVYRRADGLSDDTIYFVHADAAGMLWLGTNLGLNRFDGTRFRVLTRRHGLPFDELNLGAFLPDDTGFWLGTYDGAAYLEPRYLDPDPPLLVPSLEQPVLGEAPWPPDTVPVPVPAAHRNQLTFTFVAPHLSSPDTVRYRYRLEGFESAWTESTERRARYAALPPGTYRFTVQARSEDLPWGPATGYGFRIPRPFWQTWPFLLLVCLLLAAGAYLSVRDLRRRNRRLRLKTKVLGREVVRQRTGKLDREAELRLLHSQMNPHFLQNALNNAIYFSKVDAGKTERILSLLSRLLRHAFNTTVAGETTLSRELELVRHYLEIQALRFGERLQFTVHMDAADAACTIPCFMIQPLVENAVEHGFKEVLGELDVQARCRREGTVLVLTVSNNGRPPRQTLRDWLSSRGALYNIDTRLRLLYNRGLAYRFEAGRHHFELHLTLAEIPIEDETTVASE